MIKNINSNESIMLFDMDVEGHHATYIRHVVLYWIQESKGTDLLIIVTPRFIDLHKELVNLSTEQSQGKVKFISISKEETANLERNRKRSILRRAFNEWEIFCNYAKSLNVKHGLLMYFDYFQIPLIFGKISPCPVSGIYFRPTLHYDHLFPSKSNFKEKLKNLIKKKFLKLTLNQSQFNILFCLDQFSIDYIRRLNTKADVKYLPDPINIHKVDLQRVNILREKLKVENDRHIFLLFGSLDKRKGIYKVLEAIQHLDLQIAKHACLLFVGKLHDSDRESFKNMAAEISKVSPIQIIVNDKFIPDEDVGLYFDISHTVLIPYQNHVGMSGIVLHAASSGKRVLASNYGLLGKLVETYNLGKTIDSSSSICIAKGIQEFIEIDNFYSSNIDLRGKFVSEHSTESFKSILVKSLL